MASADKLINKEQVLYEKAEQAFNKKVEDSQRVIFDEIMAVVQSMNMEAGRLQNNAEAQKVLLALQNKIHAAFNTSGYGLAVKNFVTNFDQVTKNKIELHDVMNGKRILNSQVDPIRRLAVQSTIDNLTGAGIDGNFVYPIRQSIYRQILIGGTIADTEAEIRKYIYNNKGGDSRLLQYASQVAVDSINQFGGTIEGAIKNEFGFNAFRYVGSIIKDSRCQCRWWVQQGKIHEDQLRGEIATALNGGRLGGCNCSGMIPGTTLSNFSINRGGYRCRHQAIATNI